MLELVCFHGFRPGVFEVADERHHEQCERKPVDAYKLCDNQHHIGSFHEQVVFSIEIRPVRLLESEKHKHDEN
jgi:hypothetical protein